MEIGMEAIKVDRIEITRELIKFHTHDVPEGSACSVCGGMAHVGWVEMDDAAEATWWADQSAVITVTIDYRCALDYLTGLDA